MADNSILEVTNLTQQFVNGDQKLTVLNQLNFEVERGTTCAIVGPSGSGKTTLLGLCAGLDRPSEGQIILNGTSINGLSEDERAKIRNEQVGFVFQTFQLVPTLTALENVMVPLELRGNQADEVRKKARELLNKVGLSDRLSHYPTQLSGGEQQRVAIARAFINQPTILFADEPTGNLDAETGAKIEQLLFDLNEAAGTTLVLVSHDLSLANQCQQVIKLKNGEIAQDSSKTAVEPSKL